MFRVVRQFLSRWLRRWRGDLAEGRRYYDGGTQFQGSDPVDPDAPVRQPRRSGPPGRNSAVGLLEPDVDQPANAIGQVKYRRR